MSTRTGRIAFLGLCAALGASVSAAADDGKRVRILSTDVDPESAVSVTFVPLVTGVRPGQRFWLSAHFRIQPGYRIGWKAKSDAGRATDVTFRAPAGFDVGPAQFPVPQRFPDEGRGEWLGYEGETVVFAEVKAPSTLRRDDVIRLDLFAEWAACRDECRVARTAAFVELEAAHGDARARAAEAEVAPFRARLPKPAPPVEATWDVTPTAATLQVKMKGVTLTDFFSEGTARPAPTGITADSGVLSIQYDEAPRPGTRPLRGVVAGVSRSSPVYFEFEVTPYGISPLASRDGPR